MKLREMECVLEITHELSSNQFHGDKIIIIAQMFLSKTSTYYMLNMVSKSVSSR